MELSELVAELAKHEVKDVSDALQSSAHGHYQAIYQRGFSTAHAEAKTKLEEKDALLEAEREKVTAADSELVKLREKAPDAEAVRTQYEEKLQAKEREKTEAIEAANQRVTEVHGARFDAELAAALIATGVEPDYAREVLVPKYRGRRKVENDGTVKVYGDDEATPLDAKNGELPRVFAETIKTSVDPKWLVSNADKGGGATGGRSGGGSQWDKYRQQARERQSGNTGNPEANERKLARL